MEKAGSQETMKQEKRVLKEEEKRESEDEKKKEEEKRRLWMSGIVEASEKVVKGEKTEAVN